MDDKILATITVSLISGGTLTVVARQEFEEEEDDGDIYVDLTHDTGEEDVVQEMRIYEEDMFGVLSGIARAMHRALGKSFAVLDQEEGNEEEEEGAENDEQSSMEEDEKPWKFCEACKSYHHPNNPTCRKKKRKKR